MGRPFCDAQTSLRESARQLQQSGLITHAGLEIYHPETARFGGPSVMDSAERYFAADSDVVLAQLAAQPAGTHRTPGR